MSNQQHTRSGPEFTATSRHDTYSYIDSQNNKLQGKTVLITGASKGVGKATAISYARSGASGIALAARSNLSAIAEDVVSAAKSAGHAAPKILTCQVDVTSRESVDAAVQQVSEGFGGKLDILINNAGYLAGFAGIAQQDPDEWWKDWEVNIKGTYLVTRAFWPLLLRSHVKTILNISSIGAIFTAPGNSSYGSAKLGVLRVTEYVNQDHGVGKEGVLAIGVHPGGVSTELARGMPDHMHELLIDTPALAGDTLAWLGAERREWLGGRYVSATWDMEELVGMKEEIADKDLLKMKLTV